MKADYYRYLSKLGPVAFSRGLPYARCVEYPEVISRLQLRPSDVLLDVGSRYAPLPQILALRYGCTVHAVDPEPDFREKQLAMTRKVPAAEALRQAGKLEFRVADAADLEYPDASFTRISVISVLEHILDEGPVVDELVRVLAPGGRLVISVPFDPWRDEPRYHRRSVYVSGTESEDSFYMRYYSMENLNERLIEPSGLVLESLDTFGEPWLNAHNLVFGNPHIPWYVRRLFFQPLAPLLAPLLIRPLPPERFRRKTKMYTADVAVLVLVKPERAA